MERLVYFLIILSLSGSFCSVSKRAFRDLSRKVDLIRSSLQQDIGFLKIEVLDLRSQLESERNRADRLEELLNGTGALPDIENSPLEDPDRGEGEEVNGQASKDIFAVVRTAFHREKKRARQFESTVTQKITKVSETTDSFKSGIEHLRLTVETVAIDAQKSTHDIEDIQNELIHIRGDVDVNNDAIVDLRDAVENVTDGTHECARDIEDMQNQLIHIRGDTAASKDDMPDLQHDLLLLHEKAIIKNPGHKQQAAGCSALYANGIKQSGIYAIYPAKRTPFDVYCDMTDGGWTVIQRRIDGTVNFTRTWDEYVQGFGDVNGEYWLGLEKIHRLTKGGAEIYFDIGNYDGTREYAHYKSFTVHDATTLYKMNVDSAGYNGSIPELFSYHDDTKFTTYDRDNDDNSGYFNCAQYYGGGWWFKWCVRLGNFNGVFGKKDDSGIHYNYGRVYVKTVTIKLRQLP